MRACVELRRIFRIIEGCLADKRRHFATLLSALGPRFHTLLCNSHVAMEMHVTASLRMRGGVSSCRAI